MKHLLILLCLAVIAQGCTLTVIDEKGVFADRHPEQMRGNPPYAVRDTISPDASTGLRVEILMTTDGVIANNRDWKQVEPLQCFLKPLNTRYYVAHWDQESLKFIPEDTPSLFMGVVEAISDARYWESFTWNPEDSTFTWKTEGEFPELL